MTASLSPAAVGNHEFDEGVDELLRMQAGGCHPTGTVGLHFLDEADTVNALAPRSSTSRGASTPRSTSSSPVTPTPRTSATSRANS